MAGDLSEPRREDRLKPVCQYCESAQCTGNGGSNYASGSALCCDWWRREALRLRDDNAMLTEQNRLWREQVEDAIELVGAPDVPA